MHKLFKHTLFVGKKAFFLPSCHSTNEEAAKLIMRREQANGQVIYTDFQSKGRGQRGNSWESEEGANILISVVLDTHFIEATDFFHLNILTSLAIHDVLNEYIKMDVKIKWPNDLMFENKKIAGILIENYLKQSVIEWCIVGVGLNINQLKFNEPGAVSLAQICGQTFDREELIGLLLQKVEGRYLQLQRGAFTKLKDEYHESLYWKGQIHVFQDTANRFFNGKILGVESSGKLRLALEDGEQAFDFKEIRFIK
ncbi:MAG: biotin--[acetyl-CoA-carboxylase] ligase [Cyclobacteriaceae bacterium]|nr:biotin--[acetyl-CoA-carboxylase] ligase [Cyclobacteriaceae bacterium]